MNKIRSLRKQKGLSQEELAEETHLSRGTIINCEKNCSNAGLHTIAILAKFFDVSIEYLLEESKD